MQNFKNFTIFVVNNVIIQHDPCIKIKKNFLLVKMDDTLGKVLLFPWVPFPSHVPSHMEVRKGDDTHAPS